MSSLPPVFRFRDYVFAVIFLRGTFAIGGLALLGHLEGVFFRVLYFGLMFVWVVNWLTYRRRAGAQIRQYRADQAHQHALDQDEQLELQRSRARQARLSLHFSAAYTMTDLPERGVQMTCPTGSRYHIYEVSPQDQDERLARQRTSLARRENAKLLYFDHQGGPAVIHGQEIWIRTGPSGLAEQIQFWESSVAHQQAVRQRGVDLEVQVLGQLDATFPGWRIQKGLLMRHGGDVDALLTRPDGKVFSVDVKSHRGTPALMQGVLHFGRAEKGDVQRQLQLQAQSTGGQGVCWQPEAGYGTVWLDGLLFIGGDVLQLREELSATH